MVQTGTAEMLTLCGRPVTSSIRSSLASLSGSVDSFHVRVRCRDRGGQRATANLGGGRAGLAAAEELIYQRRSSRREYGPRRAARPDVAPVRNRYAAVTFFAVFPAIGLLSTCANRCTCACACTTDQPTSC